MCLKIKIIPRLYYQLQSKSHHLRTLCNLACKNTKDFELCDIEHIPKFGKKIFLHFSWSGITVNMK